ncbi:MAG: DUF4395 domain-containing protein [Candidatus Pacebacteria bacterium]|nr:DUF4395 domain-containing protein [Candidatus Paceibacterota bacterium]
MPKNIPACPISFKKIDENVARLNCLASLFLVIAGWLYPAIWLFLIVSFFLRAYAIELSPVYRLNQIIIRVAGIKPYMIDRAPKLFAAKIGLFMTILVYAFYYLGFQIPLILTVGFLVGATFSASFLNYCLGCKFYALFASLGLIKLHTPKPVKKKRKRK